MSVTTLSFQQPGRDRLLLGLLLLSGLVHGLLYVFLVPPWQHYDEPGHFEFAWLLAEHPYPLQWGTYDQAMRREVAASMIEHGFFRNLDFRPNMIDSVDPIWIGYPQINNTPAYYLLVSLPMRLIHYTDVTFQLYVGRLVSLVLYLLTILAAWGLARELVSELHPLRWLFPAFLVVLPGFVNVMTAVSDDVGAITAFSFFLWGSIRLIHRGINLQRLFWVIGTAALCYFTKNTIWIALPLAVLALFFAVLMGPKRKILWGVLGIGAIALIALAATSVPRDDAAFWVPNEPQSGPNRVRTQQVVFGEWALVLGSVAQSPAWEEIQFLPSSDVPHLAGGKATVGSWIWADQATEIHLPKLNVVGHEMPESRQVSVDTEPAFYSQVVEIPTGATRAWISIPLTVDAEGKPVGTYYDGLVVTKGAYMENEPPQFEDNGLRDGTWGGQFFTNLLRNPSAEQAWLRTPMWMETLSNWYPQWNGALVFASLRDWQGLGWYYWESGAQLFRTFWAKFGWGEVPLLGSHPYRPLAVWTLLGMIGAIVGLWRKRRRIDGGVTVIMGLALVAIWLTAVFRGVYSVVWQIFLPVARYGFPAALPTALVLTIGWHEIGYWLGRWLRLPRALGYIFFTILAVTFDAYALVSLTTFYAT